MRTREDCKSVGWLGTPAALLRYVLPVLMFALVVLGGVVVQTQDAQAGLCTDLDQTDFPCGETLDVLSGGNLGFNCNNPTNTGSLAYYLQNELGLECGVDVIPALECEPDNCSDTVNGGLSQRFSRFVLGGG